jgi:Holliday junction resolvasome RuvABC endonuclease subunit
MKILALDFGSKTGWAHSNGLSGSWDLRVKRDESTGMRLIRMVAKLNEILHASGVDLVVFEGVRHGNPKMIGSTTSLAEMKGAFELWANSQDPVINYRAYSPSEIKKWATGKGNAKKEAMLSAAKAKWPTAVFLDDNHVDALWLLDLAQSENF